jgi:hypothetical protein
LNDSAASALDDALALTAAMHAAALRDDWSGLAALDARRRVLVEQACARPNLDSDGLALLLARNDALIALVRNRRESLADEWRDSQHSQRAMRDYQSIARDQGAS